MELVDYLSEILNQQAIATEAQQENTALLTDLMGQLQHVSNTPLILLPP